MEDGHARSVLRRSGAQEALSSPGHPLSPGLRSNVEAGSGFDFGEVRIHSDSRAARAADAFDAVAFTAGNHIVFGQGHFNPGHAAGRALLGHELAHVVQQGFGTGRVHAAPHAEVSAEAEADRFAGSFASGSRLPAINSRVTAGTVQRKLSMRDVGRGENSGFARVPELITRMNAMSTGLTFALTGSELTYTVKPGGPLSNFDTQMQGFIDQAAVLPLRFTNKSGLLGTRALGFHDRVLADDWASGYVDIDDLLASNDLGLQSVLVHFLRERTATSNYARRIGSESLNTDPDTPQGSAHQAEFDRAHAQGIQAEVQVLRGFFGDPTIRLIASPDTGNVFRIFRNSRGDTIRTRVRPGRGAETGVDPISVEVVTRDGVVHTPEEYKVILDAARQAAAAAPVGPAVPP